jgi:hypothetical protein
MEGWIIPSEKVQKLSPIQYANIKPLPRHCFHRFPVLGARNVHRGCKISSTKLPSCAERSGVKILNESIPHIIASLFTHLLATGECTTHERNCTDRLKRQTGWGAFQIIHTNEFRTSFSRLTTNGACGVNVLPGYWAPRRSAEIASLTLNTLALLIGLILSWRLLKVFLRLSSLTPPLTRCRPSVGGHSSAWVPQ